MHEQAVRGISKLSGRKCASEGDGRKAKVKAVQGAVQTLSHILVFAKEKCQTHSGQLHRMKCTRPPTLRQQAMQFVLKVVELKNFVPCLAFWFAFSPREVTCAE